MFNVGSPKSAYLNGMKALSVCLVLAWLASGVSVAAESEPALRQELLQLKQEDQAVRLELMSKGMAHPDPAVEQRMLALNVANSQRMRAIVQRHGWPTPSLVGRDGVEAAFTLVQHGELDVQKEMLPLVEKAFKAGEIPGEGYALLFDRVRTREGKPQVYGTQARPVKEWKNGEPVLYPIEDETKVDERRGELGMRPMREYIEGLKKVYVRQ
jgi:hypothetical protein